MFKQLVKRITGEYRLELEAQEKEQAEAQKWREKREQLGSPKFNRQVIRLNKTPFDFPNTQILYIEDVYNEEVNKFIQSHLSEIKKIFASARTIDGEKFDFEFVYIPERVNELKASTNILNDNINYYYPFLENTNPQVVEQNLNSFDTVTFCKSLFKVLGEEGQIIKPGLFRYMGYDFDKDKHVYTFIDFFEPYDNLLEQIELYSYNLSGSDFGGVYFASNHHYKGEVSEDLFLPEDRKMLEKIRKQIDFLKAEGYYKLLLQEVSKDLLPTSTIDETKQVSRLIIDEEYRIFLPDYNNLEITLTPLPKALFILFLKHPEGILFPEMPKYEKELFHIYKHLSKSESYFKMKSSIADMCNPNKNSINEKASRIKEAFIQHFSEDLANQYTITGERGKRKGIQIDRGLVEIKGL